ncbi:Glyoxalase-like domain protein [compost metagenome]
MLSLVVLKAAKPEALTSLYTAFGCNFVRERHGAGPVHFACEQAGSVLEIYPRLPHHPLTSAVRLGFTVDDLDHVRCEIARHDVAVLSGPSKDVWGRHLIIRDCEGHTIHLTERDRQSA